MSDTPTITQAHDAVLTNARTIASVQGESVADVLQRIANEVRREELQDSNGRPRKTPAERARELGLVGCIHGGPSDLARNPKYLDDFGQHDSTR